jgi:hypothetical protein
MKFSGCFWRKPVVVGPGRCISTGRGFFVSIYCTEEKYGVNTCAESFFPYNIGMETKRMGRPPKPAEERQTERLEIRMTAEERALIERAAGGNTSSWARGVLVRAARRLDK